MKFIITLVLSVLFFQLGFLHAFKYDLSICAIFQDEAPYLKEWIDYHLKVGVKHFWLYNNNSSDNFRAVLSPYIKDEIVEVIDWPFTEDTILSWAANVQCTANTHALEHSKDKTEWLALIDIDEFIVPVRGNSVSACLRKYFSKASGIFINWQNYGTSHIFKLNPNKKSFDQLLLKMKWDHPRNRNGKCIVKPKYVTNCTNPHYCNYVNGKHHVNTNKEYVNVHNNDKVLIDKLRINHYWTRDEWYLYNVKVLRYIKWGSDSYKDIIDIANEMNFEYDNIINEMFN